MRRTLFCNYPAGTAALRGCFQGCFGAITWALSESNFAGRYRAGKVWDKTQFGLGVPSHLTGEPGPVRTRPPPSDMGSPTLPYLLRER